MLLWCSSFPMASFLSQSQRQAGHTNSLTPAGMKTLKNRKKIFIRDFHGVSSGFPTLAKGECSPGKGYEEEPQTVQNPCKNILSYGNYARAGHISGPWYTHFLMCISQGSLFPLLQGPNTNLTAPHKHSPRSCCHPCKPQYLQQAPLCWSEPAGPQNKVVSLSLKRLRTAFLSLKKTHNFTTITSTLRLYSLKCPRT